VTALPADPRLKQMLRDLKLADYRASGKWNDFCHPVGKADSSCINPTLNVTDDSLSCLIN
jgi:hypothetical protein